MEGPRFDSIARQLSRGNTRRGLVKSLAAAGLGVSLTRTGWLSAEARKKRKKKKLGALCRKSNQCQGDLQCQVPGDDDTCGWPTTTKRCCKKDGERCDYGCECCGPTSTCNGHVCQS
jgi:hypothetical protein